MAIKKTTKPAAGKKTKPAKKSLGNNGNGKKTATDWGVCFGVNILVEFNKENTVKQDRQSAHDAALEAFNALVDGSDLTIDVYDMGASPKYVESVAVNKKTGQHDLAELSPSSHKGKVEKTPHPDSVPIGVRAENAPAVKNKKAPAKKRTPAKKKAPAKKATKSLH